MIEERMMEAKHFFVGGDLNIELKLDRKERVGVSGLYGTACRGGRVHGNVFEETSVVATAT